MNTLRTPISVAPVGRPCMCIVATTSADLQESDRKVTSKLYLKRIQRKRTGEP